MSQAQSVFLCLLLCWSGFCNALPLFLHLPLPSCALRGQLHLLLPVAAQHLCGYLARPVVFTDPDFILSKCCPKLYVVKHFTSENTLTRIGLVMDSCKTKAWKAEAGRFYVLGHLGLYSKIVS